MRALNRLRANRRGGAGTTTAIILIIIVVVALIFVVPNMGALAGTSKKITDFLKGFFGGLGGGGGNNTSGYSAVSFKITHKDGTVEWSNTSATFALFPMTITYNAKPISNIDIYIFARLTGTAGISAWSTSIGQQLEIYKKPETTPRTSSTGQFSDSGGSWTDGATVAIAHTPIAASTIDSLSAQYGTGDYLLQINANVQLTVTQDGVSQQYQASAPSGGIDFTYTSNAVGATTLTSFTVTIQANAFSIVSK